MKTEKECKNCAYWYQDEVISLDPPDFWLADFCYKQLLMDANKCEFYMEDKMNEVEKITNFQRIKAMSIDEMTEFLNYSKCKMCINIKSHDNLPLCTGNYECLNGIKQWLESEVRE